MKETIIGLIVIILFVIITYIFGYISEKFSKYSSKDTTVIFLAGALVWLALIAIAGLLTFGYVVGDAILNLNN